MYDLVCNEFLELGGVYIKFLQGVLFTTPMMKRWRSPNRLKIFENLGTQPLDVIALLRKDLPPAMLSQIALIQTEPFAAGSFGQVYLGQHADGSRIIIKVLRPLIRDLLKFDLRLLTLFSKRWTSAEFQNVEINMDQAMKDFRAATLSETDYLTEAQFAQELYQSYKGHPTMVIPRTYRELCTPHIIVQEYIGGVSGAVLLQQKEIGADPVTYIKEHTGSDLDEQLTTLGVESLNGAFDMPKIMGDPHPGNVRFLPDNKVALIDFGISARAPRNRAAFFGILAEWNRLYGGDANMPALFEQFVRFFVNDLYRALKKMSTLMPAGAREQASRIKQNNVDLMEEVSRLVQRIFDNALGTSDIRVIIAEGRFLQAFGHMVNRGNRLGLVVNMESSELLRAAQTYITLIESLERRNQIVPRLLSETVKRVAAEHSDLVHESDMPVSASQAIETINRWLERIALRDPALFRQLLTRINIRQTLTNTPQEQRNA
jgi:serine/threonine protein kinase